MDLIQTIVLLILAVAVLVALMNLMQPEGSDQVEVNELSAEGDGCAVGGDLKDGTWCYAPDDAKKTDKAILVLRDTPKVRARVDGIEVELRSGFRGFRNVPPGSHELVVYGYQENDAAAAARVELPPGGCVVLIYEPNPNRLEPDRTYGVQYIPLALSGAMDSALLPWPNGKNQSEDEPA